MGKPIAARPNILLIHTDQHNMQALGAYGNPDVRTPNIDKLAGDGERFQNSFCPFPVCTPSRYSLLTGLYTHQHFGITNHCTVPATVETFPKLLRSAGYRTKAIGKMHFTPTYLDMGFSEMVLSEQDGPGRHDDDYHRWLRAQGLSDRLDITDQVKEFRDRAPSDYWESFGAHTSDLDEARHSTTWIGDRTEETLAQWGAEGNLLMAGFIKPHHPFDPPAPWSDMYDPEKLALPKGWTAATLPEDDLFYPGYFPNKDLTEKSFRKVLACYYGAISHIDQQVGRMIDMLRKKGLYDDTMIIFTSDHGDYMGHHHLLLKGGYLYDALAKIPLIIKYPEGKRGGKANAGSAHAGLVNTSLVNNVDLAPTILACAGMDKGKLMVGRNLAADSADAGAAGKRQDPERTMIFSESRNQCMARSERYKLLLCQNADQSQFFDLQKDPLEMNNVYADPANKEIIEDYIEKIVRWRLFDAPAPAYLNYAAPTASDSNIPKDPAAERDSSIAYFRNKGPWTTTSSGRS